MTFTADQEYARQLDAEDPLAAVRDRFVVSDPEVIYLNGNSLGRLPIATADRLRAGVECEWGGELISGWQRWLDLDRQLAELLGGPVLDAAPTEVAVSDSTSVNLYKLATAALDARPGRRVIVTDDDNFPTDRYVLDGICRARGLTLRVMSTDPDAGIYGERLDGVLDNDVALVSLSHVSYRSAAVADMAMITKRAHGAGALMLWDVSHSAGIVDVPLREADVDLAVGCTYKYLNAGPGAPAFLYVRQDLQTLLQQPIWGWFGHSDQFAMPANYTAAASIKRFLVGTPPVLSLYGVLEGARITAETGIDAIRRKAMRLTSYAVELHDMWLAPFGSRLASPRDPSVRGGHIALHHPRAQALFSAWQRRGVIADYRPPERLRVGLAPLYTRYLDVWHAFARLRQIMVEGDYADHVVADTGVRPATVIPAESG